MNFLRIAGYSSWKSPITSAIVASGAIRLDRQINEMNLNPWENNENASGDQSRREDEE